MPFHDTMVIKPCVIGLCSTSKSTMLHTIFEIGKVRSPFASRGVSIRGENAESRDEASIVLIKSFHPHLNI